MSIKELEPGLFITDLPLAVTNIAHKTTKNGSPYLVVTLCDPSGQIEAKVWNDSLNNCVDIVVGNVCLITGKVGEYQGQIDLSISKAISSSSHNFDDLLSFVPTLVFDIETVGRPFEELEEWDQEYFLHKIEGNTDPEEAKTKTGLYSLYGFVQSIGMYNPKEARGEVLALTDKSLTPENNHFEYHHYSTEKDLLTDFWNKALQYERFVTFNGRGFDFPFLVIRSGINRVKIPMEIDDYNKAKFVDLADKFRQGGRSFKLEAFCRAFGITNPKEKGVSGLIVTELYNKGDHQSIADYVARDVISTAELYNIWRIYLSGHLNF